MGAMPRGMFPKLRDIYMVSEPESCALYTVQDMVDRDRNKLTKVGLIFHYAIAELKSLGCLLCDV